MIDDQTAARSSESILYLLCLFSITDETKRMSPSQFQKRNIPMEFLSHRNEQHKSVSERWRSSLSNFRSVVSSGECRWDFRTYFTC